MSTQSINTDQTTPAAQPKSDAAKGFNSSSAMLSLMTAVIVYMGQMKNSLPSLQQNYEAMNMFQMMQGWSGNEFRAQFLSDFINNNGGMTVFKEKKNQGTFPITPEQAGNYNVYIIGVSTSSKVQSPQVIAHYGSPDYNSDGLYIVMPENAQPTLAQEWAIGMIKETNPQNDYHQASIYSGEDDAMATRGMDAMQQKFDLAKMIVSNLKEIFSTITEISGGKINQSASS